MLKTITVACLICTFLSSGAQQPRQVIKGKSDLRDWDVKENPVVSLDGNWNFYWNSLYSWKESMVQDGSFVIFSRPWNEQVIEGKELPGKGYATYTAELFLPKSMVNGNLAIEVPAVYNAHALWVNDQLVSTNGEVGTSEEEMVPEWRPRTVKIDVNNDTLRLVFHVSNFQTARGGPASAIRIGATEDIMQTAKVHTISTTLLIAFFFLLSFIFLIVFLITRSLTLLYFSGLTLAFAVRFMFSDTYPYYNFNLQVPWETAVKIEYMSVSLIVIFGVLFISSIYPIEFKRPVRISFLVVHLILIFFILLAEPGILTQLLFLIQICALAFLVYVIYAIIRALVYERAGAWVSTLGIVIFTLAGIYNLFTFLYFIELNRIVIHSCYTIAVMLNAFSLWYRTPVQIKQEEQNILRYSDLYNTEE